MFIQWVKLPSLSFIWFFKYWFALLIGIYGGHNIAQGEKAQSFTHQQIELALFKQLFITAAEAFLDNGHGDNHPYGSIRSTHVAFFEQRRKNGFVYLGGHICIKQVMPPVGIIIFFASRLPIWVEGVANKSNCGFSGVFLNMISWSFTGYNIRFFCLITKDF